MTSTPPPFQKRRVQGFFRGSLQLIRTCMTTKLTLSVDSSVIEAAKRASKRKGMSLSKIIEIYLREFSSDKRKEKSSATELIGILGRTPKSFNDKDEFYKILEEKHLR